MLDANGFKVHHATEVATGDTEIIQRLCCLLWASARHEPDEEVGLMWRNSETNEILAINHCFTDLLGWELEDQIGLIPYEDWVHPDDLDMVQTIGETNSSVPYSARIAMKAGGFKRLFVQSVSMLIDGTVHRISIVKDD